MKTYTKANKSELEDKLRSVSVEGVMDQLEKIKMMITNEGLTIENVMTKMQAGQVTSMVDQLRDVVNAVNPVVMNRLNEIHEHHARSEKTVDDIKSEMAKIPLIQSRLEDFSREWGQYLDRMKKPSGRGIQTELETKVQLEARLPMHEIVHVPSKDQKGQMDLIVRREGYPDISIDLKDYTNKNVPKSEVDKFERDVILSSSHGILVSCYSGITNKEHFHVSKINNRYAIYLSNTGGDVGEMVTAIKMLYYLDSVSEEEDRSSVRIGREELERVNGMIGENVEKIKTMRNHLKLTLQQCDEMMFEGIQRILGLMSEKVKIEEEHECGKCGRMFRNKGGLGSHKRSCT